MMATTIDRLAVKLARLKERVAVLEKVAFAAPSGYIEGWTAAAKFLGISNETCMKRSKAGAFPEPCRTDPFQRADGQTYHKPTWRMSDLVAYAEGR